MALGHINFRREIQAREFSSVESECVIRDKLIIMAAVQEVEMRVNEKADELGQLEFEYESKIKISDLEVAKVENAGVQVALVFSDMIEKVKYEEMLEKSFLMHATPEKMSEFLAENSLTVFFVSIADNRLLGEFIYA